jgi:hypothetical protein
MDWDKEQICHWLTAVGLGHYVQVFHFSFWLGKEGGPQWLKAKIATVCDGWDKSKS